MALTPTEEAQTRALLAQQAELLTLAGSEPAIMSSLGATDVNLSQLPSAGSVADADILLLRQGSTDKSVAGLILKSYAQPAAASETVSGIVELATNAEVQAGTDSVRAVTPAGRRSDTATSSSDPTYVDNSTKSASTQWLKAGFSSNIATNGYIKFPTWLFGIIIQWGLTPSSSGSANVSCSFPFTFPSSVYSLCIFPGTTTLSICATLGSLSTASFSYSIWNTVTGVRRAGDAAFFIAFGN